VIWGILHVHEPRQIAEETTFANLCTIFTPHRPKSGHIRLSFCYWNMGSIFIHVKTAGSRRREIEWKRVYDHSGSFNIIEIGTNRNPMCDFLVYHWITGQ